MDNKSKVGLLDDLENLVIKYDLSSGNSRDEIDYIKGKFEPRVAKDFINNIIEMDQESVARELRIASSTLSIYLSGRYELKKNSQKGARRLLMFLAKNGYDPFELYSKNGQ